MHVSVGFVLVGAAGLVSVLSYLQLASIADSPAISVVVGGEPAAVELISVVIAGQPVKRGQRITPEFLSEIRVEPPLPPGAMRRAEAIFGAVAIVEIPQGQIITEGSLLLDEGNRSGLSILVPDGLRAVALRMNDEISVGNFIRPNDRVDILLVLASDRVARVLGKDIRIGDHAETSVLLQNVLILSIGDTLSSPDGQTAATMKNITVAVSPEDALLLGIAEYVGKFYLALRNPKDERVIIANRKRVEDLLSSVRPVPGSKQPPPRRTQTVTKPKSSGHSITIFRGNSMSTQTFPEDDES